MNERDDIDGLLVAKGTLTADEVRQQEAIADHAVEVNPVGSPPLMFLANEPIPAHIRNRITREVPRMLAETPGAVLLIEYDIDVFQLIDGRWMRLERRESKNQ